MQRVGRQKGGAGWRRHRQGGTDTLCAKEACILNADHGGALALSMAKAVFAAVPHDRMLPNRPARWQYPSFNPEAPCHPRSWSPTCSLALSPGPRCASPAYASSISRDRWMVTCAHEHTQCCTHVRTPCKQDSSTSFRHSIATAHSKNPTNLLLTGVPMPAFSTAKLCGQHGPLSMCEGPAVRCRTLVEHPTRPKCTG